jgi:isochorismate synthase
MVAEAVLAVEAQEVAKVVVARQVDVLMDEAIDVAALLRRWHRLEPTCSVFSMTTSEGQLVGASPELLVERTGLRVHSRPLAGTTDRANETNGILPRELLASVKDSAEHRMVVEAIGGALAPLCSDLDVPTRPDLVHLHNITHLGTSVTGTLDRRPDGSVPTALELVAALHPTPAVGGVPRDRALALIARLEPEARGHYAGPVGYVDARGDGCWMLGIRAVTINGPHARLAAGVGVVDGSDPRTERVETILKLTAVFDALAPGIPFTTRERPPAHEAVG